MTKGKHLCVREKGCGYPGSRGSHGLSRVPQQYNYFVERGREDDGNRAGRGRGLLPEYLEWGWATVRDGVVQGQFSLAREKNQACSPLRMSHQPPRVNSGHLPRSGNRDIEVYFWKQLMVLDRNITWNWGLIRSPIIERAGCCVGRHWPPCLSSFLGIPFPTFHWVLAKVSRNHWIT